MQVELQTNIKHKTRQIIIGDLVYNRYVKDDYYIVIGISEEAYHVASLVTGEGFYINSHRDLIELVQDKMTIYNN